MNSSYMFLSFSEMVVLTALTLVANSSSVMAANFTRIFIIKTSRRVRICKQFLVDDWIKNQALIMSRAERDLEKTTYPSCSFVRN